MALRNIKAIPVREHLAVGGAGFDPAALKRLYGAFDTARDALKHTTNPADQERVREVIGKTIFGLARHGYLNPDHLVTLATYRAKVFIDLRYCDAKRELQQRLIRQQFILLAENPIAPTRSAQRLSSHGGFAVWWHYSCTPQSSMTRTCRPSDSNEGVGAHLRVRRGVRRPLRAPAKS